MIFSCLLLRGWTEQQRSSKRDSWASRANHKCKKGSQLPGSCKEAAQSSGEQPEWKQRDHRSKQTGEVRTGELWRAEEQQGWVRGRVTESCHDLQAKGPWYPSPAVKMCRILAMAAAAKAKQAWISRHPPELMLLIPRAYTGALTGRGPTCCCSHLLAAVARQSKAEEHEPAKDLHRKGSLATQYFHLKQPKGSNPPKWGWSRYSAYLLMRFFTSNKCCKRHHRKHKFGSKTAASWSQSCHRFFSVFFFRCLAEQQNPSLVCKVVMGQTTSEWEI